MTGFNRVRTFGGQDESRGEAPLEWMTDGLCSSGQFDPDLWFAGQDDHPSTAQALSVCGQCPVRQTCLEYALDERWLYGIWGGTTSRQRTRLRSAVARERAS